MAGITRRATMLALPAAGLLLKAPAVRAATPSCGDHPTPRSAEGPYFKPKSPQRASLIEPDMRAERLVLNGRVMTAGCNPLARVLLDFWHADPAGRYDNAGFRFRGHQFTDAEGRFRLETLTPGLYPGRARHLHVKVQAAGGRILTTQLYFPDDPSNARDGLFNSALIMAVGEHDGAKAAAFDFVVT